MPTRNTIKFLRLQYLGRLDQNSEDDKDLEQPLPIVLILQD